MVAFTGIHPVRAQSASSLAAQYAPVLHFSSAEQFYPTSVDYVISSSTVVTRAADGSLTTVDPNPTSATLGNYNDPNDFLNNKNGNLSAIAADYAAKGPAIGYYAYVHVINTGSGTVLQYWMLYAYNVGQLNDHQSDWECIQVFLDASGNPYQATYGQHAAGETAAWSDVETSNGHPVVYVAQGSHESYFRSYQGRIGIEDDIVKADGMTITPDKLNLVVLGNQSWLNFPGRWGYVGTPVEQATGNAGPHGPQFNDWNNWSDPSGFASRTLSVNGYYFDLAFVFANLLLIFVAYVLIRGVIKLYHIVRLRQKGGLRVGRFLKGRGGVAVVIGLIGIGITLAALFLPWYTVTVSSQSGPYAGGNAVTLMQVDGVHGLSVNLLTGPNADGPAGLTTFASAQFPFAIIIGVGLALLLLDIIGIKKGSSLGRKFIFGAITSLLPFVFIYAFVAYLPNLLPYASSLIGQPIPSDVAALVNMVASSPVSGSSTQTLPVAGTTTLTWGYGIGAYLFLAAAVVRIIAGFISFSAPSLEAMAAPAPPQEMMPPPPPPPMQPA
jgi:hypothetical protein